MIIEFYKIDGIDFSNTFYSSSRTARYQYLSSFRIYQSDEIFYPLFLNKDISLSIEDNEILKANYCAIYETENILDLNSIATHDILERFYFVNSVTYQTDTLRKFNLTLDTIQTFMYISNINSLMFNRQTIKRWKSDGTINRNYIRENLSKSNNFIKEVKERKNKPAILVKWGFPSTIDTKDNFYPFVDPITSERELKYINGDNKEQYNIYEYNTNFIYSIFPLFNDEPKIDSGLPYYEFALQDGDYKQLYKWGSVNKIENDNPYILSINLVNLYDFPNVIEINNDNVIFDNKSYGFMELKDKYNYQVTKTIKTYGLLITDYYINNYINTIDILNPFEIAKGNKNNFLSYKNFPQIIDENYLKINYGKLNEYVSYPLHFLTNNNLKGYEVISLDENNVNFALTNGSLEDINITINNVSLPSTLTLKNDSWKTWLSQNKVTLDVAKNIRDINLINSLFQTASNSIQQAGVAMITGNPISAMNSATNLINGGFNAGANYLSTSENIRAVKENNQNAPSNFRQHDNSIVTKIFNANDNILMIEKVNDIENVAKLFNMYGFKVNDIRNTKGTLKDNIDNFIKNHAYFDYVECNLLSFSLDKYNLDNIRNDFKQRLENGIRFWYVKDGEFLQNSYLYVNDEI